MADAFGCVNNSIRLRSGKYFDLADPKPDQFDFADIAGALAKICRFGGQCDHFYSVAEHCWHCCHVARNDGMPLDTQIAVLMHDAAEAFCGDVVKPLKVMLPEYWEIERKVESAIAEKFQIDFAREDYTIREIDHAVLIAERKSMFSSDDVVWIGENEVRKLLLVPRCWRPNIAEQQFTRMAKWIGINTKHANA